METIDIILGVLLGWFVLWCLVTAFSLGGEK